MKEYVVAVVGVTGAVGQTMLRILENRSFPIKELVPLASSKSAGKTLRFGGRDYKIREATPDAFEGVDIALFSAGGSVSEKLAPEAVKKGALVVDNTSHFRMAKEVPLVVPEINPDDIYNHQGIIANPNCSTIQMVVALQGVRNLLGIKKIVVSTYQAVSGTGMEAIKELKEQSEKISQNKAIEPSVYPHQISFNLIPQIDTFEENGFTKEEMKMINETKKIFHDEDIVVNATCVRVPVVTGHSESIYVETKKDFTLKELETILSKTEGIQFSGDRNAYPMPVKVEGEEDVFVGRVRKDPQTPKAFSLWVVADNLVKGAALNAVQIAEKYIEKR